jgi:hypothetical protein
VPAPAGMPATSTSVPVPCAGPAATWRSASMKSTCLGRCACVARYACFRKACRATGPRLTTRARIAGGRSPRAPAWKPHSTSPASHGRARPISIQTKVMNRSIAPSGIGTGRALAWPTVTLPWSMTSDPDTAPIAWLRSALTAWATPCLLRHHGATAYQLLAGVSREACAANPSTHRKSPVRWKTRRFTYAPCCAPAR